jgi:hypothetical protein
MPSVIHFCFRKDHESLVLRDAQTYSHLFTGGRIDLPLIVSALNRGQIGHRQPSIGSASGELQALYFLFIFMV